jgi:hypothetical protein
MLSLGPGPPGRLSALSVFLRKSFFYGAFVWARRALNGPKQRFPARAAVIAHFASLITITGEPEVGRPA